MNINSSYSSIDEAFDFIETKIRHRPELVELPDFTFLDINIIP